MVAKFIARLIGFTELSIGIVTILGLTLSSLLHLSTKSPVVFVFVLISAIISASIGMGLLRCLHWARMSLIFFSGYIVLTKLVLFWGLIKLNGEMATLIPTDLKNLISVLYHTFIILFFNLRIVKERFCAKLSR